MQPHLISITKEKLFTYTNTHTAHAAITLSQLSHSYPTHTPVRSSMMWRHPAVTYSDRFDDCYTQTGCVSVGVLCNRASWVMWVFLQQILAHLCLTSSHVTRNHKLTTNKKINKGSKCYSIVVFFNISISHFN